MNAQMEKKCFIGGVSLTAQSIFNRHDTTLLSFPSTLHCDCLLPSLFNRMKQDFFISLSSDSDESLILHADYSDILSVFPIIRSLFIFTPKVADSTSSSFWMFPIHLSVTHFSVLMNILDSQSHLQVLLYLDSLSCSVINSSLHSLSLITSIQYDSVLTVRFFLSFSF